MHRYLCYKSNIILSKTVFECKCQSSRATKRPVLWHVRVRSTGTTNFSSKYFKAMFLLQLISILLISVTFYVHLACIVFSCDLAFMLLSYTP